MSKVIGFAGKFYTLWDFQNETIYTTDSYGNHWPTRAITHYHYIKNISTDICKVQELYPGLSIDDGLKGKSWSFTKENKQQDLCPQIMKFGKYTGRDINDLVQEDFNYVLWLVGNSGNSANGKYAKELPQVAKHIQSEEKALKDQLNSQQQTFKNLAAAGTFTFLAERNLRVHNDFAYITIPVGNVFATFMFADYSTMEYNGHEYALPVINGKAKRIKGKDITVTFVPNESDGSIYELKVTSLKINK